MTTSEKKSFRSGLALGLAGLVLAAAAFAWWAWPSHAALPPLNYQPRQNLDSSGFTQVAASTKWDPAGSLQEIANAWRNPGYRVMQSLDSYLSAAPGPKKIKALLVRASLANYEGEPRQAYKMLNQLRSDVETDRDCRANSSSRSFFTRDSRRCVAAKPRIASSAEAKAPASCRLHRPPFIPIR